MKNLFITLGKIILFLFGSFCITGILQLGVFFVYSLVSTGSIDLSQLKNVDQPVWYNILMTAGMVVSVFIMVFIFWKIWDRKTIRSIGFQTKGYISSFVGGSLIAVAVMVIGFVVLYLTGNITVESIQFIPVEFIGYFILFILVSVSEELLFRGYILSRLLDVTNKFGALIISSLLFACVHISNPNMGFLPMLNLFLAGMLLGVAYLYTRNLWLPIGMHLFWNFVQGPILGYNVSGTTNISILTLSYPENNILNGGDFGFEGSIVCSVLCVIGILAMIAYYERRVAKPPALPITE